jgi:hypothetical protein
MNVALLFVALATIAGLAFYAGSLLFKLRTQNHTRQKKTQIRIDNISESIQTIAKATDQKQCELSEACIRICHLLEALPVLDKPDFPLQYSSLYQLFDAIKDLPTHQARKEQSKLETRKQDRQREELEIKLEPKIRKEISKLVNFSI